MSSRAETVEVPMTDLGGGSWFIADADILELGPEGKAFIARFSDCWERDDRRCGYIMHRLRDHGLAESAEDAP